jgi:3-hydroxyisobutyrate dehydrogenase-like beta-hydroxyacid dehydrogenase
MTRLAFIGLGNTGGGMAAFVEKRTPAFKVA